jgi:hypothetical protein
LLRASRDAMFLLRAGFYSAAHTSGGNLMGSQRAVSLIASGAAILLAAAVVTACGGTTKSVTAGGTTPSGSETTSTASAPKSTPTTEGTASGNEAEGVAAKLKAAYEHDAAEHNEPSSTREVQCTKTGTMTYSCKTHRKTGGAAGTIETATVTVEADGKLKISPVEVQIGTH